MVALDVCLEYEDSYSSTRIRVDEVTNHLVVDQ
jgi:hypothetical protein